MNSLEKRLIFGIITVSILLIITGIIAYKTLNDSIETARQVAATHEILTEIEATLSTLKDAETGQRGFLIAGQENYLEPFQQANEQINKRIERLKMLTAHNPQHQERLAAAEPLIKAKFEELHRTIKLRRNDGFVAAQKVVVTNEGKEKMDALRKLFGEMEQQENTELQTHLTSATSDSRNVMLAFIILFTLIISLLCQIFFLVRRDIAARNQLEIKLQELAATDALTGIYNRREMLRQLKQEIGRSQRYGNRVSLLLLDIDYFKAVNDKYGHRTGDEVLKRISDDLRQSLRTTDILARYGGEEFIIILPETIVDEAAKIAERLRLKIASAPMTISQNADQSIEIPITVSIGVAELSSGMTETDLIETADRALYRAKSEGRNRVVCQES